MTRMRLGGPLALWGLALVAGLVALAPVGADDAATYDLLGPGPKKGQVVTTTTKASLKDGKVQVDTGTMQLDLETSSKSTSNRRLEVLEVKGRKIQKAKLKVIKEETTQTIGFGGMSKDVEEKGALSGQTMLLVRGKDGWKPTLEDNAEPTDAQKKKLVDLDLDGWEEHILPAKKVAVGHKWVVDASKVPRLFDSKLSDGSGKINGRFVKLEKIGGQQCAVIELDVDVKGTGSVGGEKLKVEFKGKATLHRSLALGANLKTKIDVKVRFHGKNKTPDGGEADVDLRGQAITESTATVK